MIKKFLLQHPHCTCATGIVDAQLLSMMSLYQLAARIPCSMCMTMVASVNRVKSSATMYVCIQVEQWIERERVTMQKEREEKEQSILSQKLNSLGNSLLYTIYIIT
jgi:hypothetical protein